MLAQKKLKENPGVLLKEPIRHNLHMRMKSRIHCLSLRYRENDNQALFSQNFLQQKKMVRDGPTNGPTNCPIDQPTDGRTLIEVELVICVLSLFKLMSS